jgi:hypothetical protein
MKPALLVKPLRCAGSGGGMGSARALFVVSDTPDGLLRRELAYWNGLDGLLMNIKAKRPGLETNECLTTQEDCH